MSPISPEGTASGGAESAEVLGLLGHILALPEQQRLALGQAWSALDPVVRFGQGGSDGPFEATEVEDGLLDQAELTALMSELRSTPPRTQILELQLALERKPDDWAARLLAKELDKVKSEHLGVVVEIAVLKAVRERPVLLTMFMFIIGACIYRFGRSIFHVVF